MEDEGTRDVSSAVGGSGKNPLRVIFQIWGKNGGNDPRVADRKDDKDKTIRRALCLLASDRRVAESWRRQRQMSAQKKRGGSQKIQSIMPEAKRWLV